MFHIYSFWLSCNDGLELSTSILLYNTIADTSIVVHGRDLFAVVEIMKGEPVVRWAENMCGQTKPRGPKRTANV